MKTATRCEQPDFQENAVYERIISDLQTQKYSIPDSFFNLKTIASLRDSLLSKQAENFFKKAAIGNKTNESVVKKVRGDYIFWLNETTANPAEKRFFSKINDWVNYLNQTCFMGILQKEFHYAIYPEGTFYKRHVDGFQNDDRRKLSFVCYLNDADWKPENGGELVLYLNEHGGEVQKNIFPFPGRVVIFESRELEHEVKPVLHSERLSITGWLKTR